MSASKFTEFNLPRNAYAAFDAVSLKQLIKNRLKESGLFTDIDFEGSNISAIVDVIAYSYHLSLFYLNQTASESLFSQSELFENINKIVSLIGYKATGDITSSLNCSVSADAGLDIGSYTIKRFSNLTTQGVTYSFNKDITFQKTVDGDVEYIESIGDNNLLYQGVFREYPLYTALGEKFEQFTLNIDFPTDVKRKMVDSNNIYVYVKDFDKNKWFEWTEIDSLYSADAVSKVFEKRLNEFGHFEIKFGNDINGKKLSTGDIVAIYYLESDGSRGVVGVNATNNAKVVNFSTQLFNEIFDDVKSDSNYLDANGLLKLSLNNYYASIPPTFTESADSIRKNAPSLFASQNRVVSETDYKHFVDKNFSGVVQSVKVVDNGDYTREYLGYFYQLGLEKPNLDDKVLFNQISFNDACDFNNVYIFGVPKLGAIQNETSPVQLFPAQKQAIVNKLDTLKMVGQNVVVSDPVYIAFDVGLPSFGETVTKDIRDTSKIRILRETNQLISKEQIKNAVHTLIVDFFSQSKNELGQTLDLSQLSYDILSLNGVKSIETVRNSGPNETKVSKLSFVYWNPLYPTVNIQTTAQNLNLSYFQFPFLYEASKLINKIEIV